MQIAPSRSVVNYQVFGNPASLTCEANDQDQTDLAFRCPVGEKLVRNEPFGNEVPVLYQFNQKPLCGAFGSLGLKDFLKDRAVLIDRACSQYDRPASFTAPSSKC